MDFSSPVEKLDRVGPIHQKRLKKLGINTVQDLLFHFPHRYEDFSNIINISQLVVAKNSCIQGKILDIGNERTFRKKISLTQAIIEDKTGAVKAVWFNQPYLINTLKKGDFVCLAGKPGIGDSGIYFSNPIYEKIPSSVFRLLSSDLTHTGRIVPIYPETFGLSSRWLRYILKPLLQKFKGKIPETLPKQVIKEHKLLPINIALWQIHFPDSMVLAKTAQQRFSFEQLFNISVFVLGQRLKMSQQKGVAIPLNLDLIKRFVKSLSFTLTNAQKKSAWQILKDLEKPRPMNRLLEGDVGSGKTVVAVMAALNTARAGHQAAFMAPTEILAKQHFKEVSRLLQGFDLDVGLLTGKQDKFISKKLKNQEIEISRQKLLEKAKDKEIDILIGTHALIQDKVKFSGLGLIILDEQHRFGVNQRAKLSQQPLVPHLLSMTATPIPRTLALTIYGDLDLSLLDELPKGRKKIITELVSPANRQKTYDFIREQIEQGRQVFVICPRIEASPKQDIHDIQDIQPIIRHRKSDKIIRLTMSDKRVLDKRSLAWLDVKAVEEEYEKLDKEIFPDLKIGILHGRLAVKEKERTMRDFKDKKVQILVSTSVVEVGIDVPNASVMMIEGAERFGLAQLHQFRGRVGRSKHQSFCFLFTDSWSRKTRQRLTALLDCEDGFALAEKDLEIRGPGDFKGTRQWGIPDLAMSALKDLKLVEKARESAKQILEQDPGLTNYPFLKNKIAEFGQKVHLE